MPVTGTLYDVLTVANPVLGLGFQPNGPVSKSDDYVRLTQEDITPWYDLTFDNIASAYGQLFDIPVESDAINLRGSPAEIRNETGVDTVVQKWNHEICRYPLNHQEESSRDTSKDKKPYMPDWCIFQRDSSRSVLVWGESKCSSKWATVNSTLQQQNNWLWPFRQIATYCINNGTRYAYILTPEELVAIRFIATPGVRAGCGLQMQSIPWTNSGPGQLTVNLTIWALAMMAVNEAHRPIQLYEWTFALNDWWQLDQQSFKHHLSGRELGTLPPGAVVRPRPDRLPVAPDLREPPQGSRSTRTSRR